MANLHVDDGGDTVDGNDMALASGAGAEEAVAWLNGEGPAVGMRGGKFCGQAIAGGNGSRSEHFAGAVASVTEDGRGGFERAGAAAGKARCIVDFAGAIASGAGDSGRKCLHSGALAFPAARHVLRLMGKRKLASRVYCYNADFFRRCAARFRN